MAVISSTPALTLAKYIVLCHSLIHSSSRSNQAGDSSKQTHKQEKDHTLDFTLQYCCGLFCWLCCLSFNTLRADTNDVISFEGPIVLLAQIQ